MYIISLSCIHSVHFSATVIQTSAVCSVVSMQMDTSSLFQWVNEYLIIAPSFLCSEISWINSLKAASYLLHVNTWGSDFVINTVIHPWSCAAYSLCLKRVCPAKSEETHIYMSLLWNLPSTKSIEISPLFSKFFVPPLLLSGHVIFSPFAFLWLSSSTHWFLLHSRGAWLLPTGNIKWLQCTKYNQRKVYGPRKCIHAFVR